MPLQSCHPARAPRRRPFGHQEQALDTGRPEGCVSWCPCRFDKTLLPPPQPHFPRHFRRREAPEIPWLTGPSSARARPGCRRGRCAHNGAPLLESVTPHKGNRLCHGPKAARPTLCSLLPAILRQDAAPGRARGAPVAPALPWRNVSLPPGAAGAIASGRRRRQGSCRVERRENAAVLCPAGALGAAAAISQLQPRHKTARPTICSKHHCVLSPKFASPFPRRAVRGLLQQSLSNLHLAARFGAGGSQAAAGMASQDASALPRGYCEILAQVRPGDSSCHPAVYGGLSGPCERVRRPMRPQKGVLADSTSCTQALHTTVEPCGRDSPSTTEPFPLNRSS